MRIGIVGAGRIGGTAARLLIGAGHEVGLCNSRGPASLAAQIEELGPRACAMSVGEAVRFADVLMLALPWRNFTGLPSPSDLSGKVVIDAMNPYGPDGTVLDLGPTTSSEEVARRLPGARLVKAFNTIYFSTLATRGRPDRPLSERLSIFVAGDDTAAKRVVEDLIVQIGFAPIDTGSLREGGRRQQPGSAVYAAELTPAGARAALAQSAASAPSPSP